MRCGRGECTGTGERGEEKNTRHISSGPLRTTPPRRGGISTTSEVFRPLIRHPLALGAREFLQRAAYNPRKPLKGPRTAKPPRRVGQYRTIAETASDRPATALLQDHHVWPTPGPYPKRRVKRSKRQEEEEEDEGRGADRGQRDSPASLRLRTVVTFCRPGVPLFPHLRGEYSPPVFLYPLPCGHGCAAH